MNTTDNDSQTIQYNINNAKEKWFRLAPILKKQGADARVMSVFYKTIIKVVLLYGAETWVLKNRDIKSLQSFHHRCARHMSNMHIKKVGEKWTYLSTKDVLERCHLKPITEYISNQKENLKNFIKEKEIWEKCKNSKTISTNNNQITWWEQQIFNEEEL